MSWWRIGRAAPLFGSRVNVGSSPTGWNFFIVNVCSFFKEMHFRYGSTSPISWWTPTLNTLVLK